MCPVSLPCPDLVCLVFFGQIRPFSGDRKDMLHFLDMTSSVVLFLTLWAGSVFTTFPRCIDMKDMQSTTSTLGWCDGLSVVVGLVVIGFIGVLVACFVWFQVYAKNPEPKEGATADAMDAVELVEQTTMEDDDGDIYEGGGEEKKREFTNPMEPHHRRHKTEEGEVFYENTKTGETSWEKPSGFVEEKDEKKTSELNINICDD